MEEDLEEQKHVCKLCDRRFPCGRSLGGHMRSHVIIMNNNNNNHNSDETLKKKKKKKKLSSVNNNGGFNNKSTIGDTSFEGGGGYQIGYGLRENPKKTFRFEKEGEEDGNLVNDKLCKECGKGFQSWKALFGHMKCHSDKVHNKNSFLEEQSSSWTNNANQKLVMDSQSDNDTSAPARRLNRRRSSRRRRTRYMAAASATAATTSSSLSLANYASSSVTEIEQEQEEVALCLMMLSRDVGHWVGLNSAAESSDNDSVFLEAPPPPSLRINQVMDKSTICDGSLRIGPMMKRLEVPLDVFPGNDNYKFEVSEVELGKSMIKPVGDQAPLGSNKYNSSKKRLCGADLVLNSSKKTIFDASDSELCKSSSYKRSKFECTTCNKIFHSYQALGGHRASHKRIKGCSASKIESCENSIETELISPEQTTVETKLMIKSYNNGKNPIQVAPAASYAEKLEAAKKASKKSISSIKGHECPICFKVFSSGQALGGHKRSHLVNSPESNIDHYHHQAIIIQKPNRDFLDLNLPAPVEEESNTNNGHVGVKPWWVGGSHKHEALFGLISN